MLRQATPADHAPLGQMMFDPVRKGPSPYSEVQRAAWLPAPRAGSGWTARLADQYIVLSEGPCEIEGFMGLRGDGYIDFA